MSDVGIQNDRFISPDRVQPIPFPTAANDTQDVPLYLKDPSGGAFRYTNPNAFINPNTSNIYDALNEGLNRSYSQSPIIQQTNLSPAQTFNGGQLQTANDTAYQGAQNKYINSLTALGAGQGPSVAGLAAKTSGQQNLDATMAFLGSQRGASNPAVAQRAAANALVNANQTTAQNEEQGRVAEELGAQGLVGQGLQTARGQTQTTAENIAATDQATQAANAAAINQNLLTQGGMTQQTNISQAQTQQQQTNLNNQIYQAMVQQAQGQNQTDISNQIAYEQMISQQQEGIASLNAGKDIAADQKNLGIAGASVSAGAALLGLAAMSDKNRKTKIKIAKRELQEFLSFFEGE